MNWRVALLVLVVFVLSMVVYFVIANDFLKEEPTQRTDVSETESEEISEVRSLLEKQDPNALNIPETLRDNFKTDFCSCTRNPRW